MSNMGEDTRFGDALIFEGVVAVMSNSKTKTKVSWVGGKY